MSGCLRHPANVVACWTDFGAVLVLLVSRLHYQLGFGWVAPSRGHCSYGSTLGAWIPWATFGWLWLQFEIVLQIVVRRMRVRSGHKAFYRQRRKKQ
jgi:hypothetical protein